jgi:xanthine dehydrogenase YagS FAD-binding subunit
MQPFQFEQAESLRQVSSAGTTLQGQINAGTQYLAGGTTLIDLMKLNVLTPRQVIDLKNAPDASSEIALDAKELKLGAFAKMSAVADHVMVQSRFPVIAESLQLAASPQLRNMATLGGNVLQRTRCPYYRDVSWSGCNKRTPGSGCDALAGFNRNHAVLGIDESCIAQYPGDFAVALITLDAKVDLLGRGGARSIDFSALHRPLNHDPHLETTLRDGEIVVGFRVPIAPWSQRSRYVKVRDRASYEFAIASAAVALDLEGEVVRQARIGLGGVAYRPWRSIPAESALLGKPLTESSARVSAEVALQGARTHGYNDYKPELARRTLVRALLEAKALAVS